jgi:glycerol-3-phosphate dehydrogenase (NAD(P)+)
VALSGPSLALEVVRGVPTAVVAACEKEDRARAAQKIFFGPRFRVYTSTDTIGVELGGALKNVIAIAAGISDGLGFGDNARGALLTRGLAEMTRLGVAMGAKAETFSGLSGVGDLVTTCSSGLSRNHRVGTAIAQGKKLPDVLAEMVMVAEGVRTTRAASRLAKRHGVEMPIVTQMEEVLFEGKDPREGVMALMQREPKAEGA